MTPTQLTLDQIALSWEEYRLIYRWQLRVSAYANLLRDEYPLFSIEPDPGGRSSQGGVR